MKKIRLLTLLILGLMAGSTAFAQNRVSGVVTESENGQPLAGVVVQLQGTTTAVLTGNDGSFAINNAQVANGTLVFNYAGMRKLEVQVQGRTNINVTMQPEALQAEAVTVTALGIKKQNRKLGYATATVQGDELARTNTVSPVNALQGKVAGLQISSISTSGITSTPSITIRGSKSLTKNNTPIFVIDGIIMQYDQQGIGGQDVGTASVYGNQLKNLNPDDYENITVLKGAAATALYGSRGANGAIVITTKTGKARKGIGVEVNYSHEWQTAYRSPIALQNKYGMGDPTNSYEGDFLPGTYNPTNNSYTLYSYSKKQMNAGYEMTATYKQPDAPLEPFVSYEDSWKAFYSTGRYDNVTVALTGGSDQATFRLSYGYMDSKSPLPNNKFSRHSINFSTNGKINDVFSVDFNFQYTNSKAKNPLQGNGWNNSTSMGMATAYYVNRSTDLQYMWDNWYNPETYERNQYLIYGDTRSMINRFIDENEERQEQTIIAKLGLTAQFTDWLDANVSMSFNDFKQQTVRKNWGSGIYRSGGGYYGVSGSDETTYNGMAQIHSNNRFIDDNLELDVRVVSEIYGNGGRHSYSKGTNGGLVVPGLWSFNNSVKTIVLDGNNYVNYYPRNNMVMGVAGIVNLSWKDQINLELTARNDWVSSLLYPAYLPDGADEYSVFYPSANVSWVFSDTFNIDPNILSFGQLRASLSQVGMGTAPYDTASGTGGYKTETRYAPDGSQLSTAYPNNSVLPNYGLKPEKQQSLEIGANLRFWESRIGLDVTYYKTNTKNQIMKINTVRETGVTQRNINAGNIQNQGWEIELDVTPIRTRTVRWNIGANWTRNRGKIKEFHPDVKYHQIHAGLNSGGIYAFEGGSYGVITSGPGWGHNMDGSYYGYAGATLKWNNANDPNDPRNGKKLLHIASSRSVPSAEYYANSGYREYVTTYASGPYVVPGYYGQEASYWGGESHEYDIMGKVEPKFLYGIHTTVNVNIPNAGSVDFYAQIDGRQGGNMLNAFNSYVTSVGNTKSSLYGRDAANGGVERVNYKGEVEQSGLILDGVYLAGNSARTTITSLKTGQSIDLAGMTHQEAIDAGHITPVYGPYYQLYNNNITRNMDMNNSVSSASYMALREITVGYNFPEKWIKHVGMQSARISFTARNICYISNKLVNKTNPESLTNNNPLIPFDWMGSPFVRNFSVSLNLRF